MDLPVLAALIGKKMSLKWTFQVMKAVFIQAYEQLLGPGRAYYAFNNILTICKLSITNVT